MLFRSMLARLRPVSDADHAKLKFFPDIRIDKTFHAKDLTPGPEIFFAGSGIATGHFLKGVEIEENGAKTYSFLTRAKTGTFRRIEARHFFDRKPVY